VVQFHSGPATVTGDEPSTLFRGLVIMFGL